MGARLHDPELGLMGNRRNLRMDVGFGQDNSRGIYPGIADAF